MKHILFCLVTGLVVAGCLVNAQSRRAGDSNIANGANNSINTDGEYGDVNATANASLVTNFNALPGSRRGRLARKDLLYDVCGNPALKCDTSGDFRAEDLPIKISGELELFGEYRSKTFFAVILMAREGDPDDAVCENRFSEEQRLGAQKLFPNNKVFTSAAGCPNFPHIYEHAYNTSFAGDHILAMYAGKTEIQAKAVLKKVLATKAYPHAEVEKVQATLCVACP